MKDCPEMIQKRWRGRFGVGAEYAPLLFASAVIYKKFLEITRAEAIWIPGTGIATGSQPNMPWIRS